MFSRNSSSGDYHAGTSKKFTVQFDLAQESPRTTVQPSVSRPIGELPEDGNQEILPLFIGGERISGKVRVSGMATSGRPLGHNGMSIELVYDVHVHGHPSSQVLLNRCEIAPTGYIPNAEDEPLEFDFDFGAPDFKWETFHGKIARCQLYVRLTVSVGRRVGMHHQEIALYLPKAASSVPEGKKILENVAITDPATGQRSLNIGFKFNTDNTDLAGTVDGKIVFSTLKLPLDSMVASLVRRESVALGIEDEGGPQTAVTSEKIEVGEWELMDGSPTSGTVVPMRIFIGSAGRSDQNQAMGSALLTPTITNVHNRFSVRYYLVVFFTANNGADKYMKQYEITLHRLNGQL